MPAVRPFTGEEPRSFTICTRNGCGNNGGGNIDAGGGDVHAEFTNLVDASWPEVRVKLWERAPPPGVKGMLGTTARDLPRGTTTVIRSGYRRGGENKAQG